MGLEELLVDVKILMDRDVRIIIQNRIKEFEELGMKGIEEIFKELCFCILTAGYSAEGGMNIQKKIDDGFLNLSEEELSKKLRELGHRFPEARAKYIVRAREKLNLLSSILSASTDDKYVRELLVKNIDGLGYKEASHFLRNIGRLNVAIIDYHILDLLDRYRVFSKPKTLTKRRYLEIERALENISERLGIKLGELDLYLWYLETGKILK
ncbi:MAG: N-glycosylase/DNA lyase [Nitrososphaerales archaeon]|nr:N-glycosylase/DNA lyase [Nitrososphaerales archaeon]